jgi:FkbM family methyltransferase
VKFKKHYKLYQRRRSELNLTPHSDEWHFPWHGMEWLKECIGEDKHKGNKEKSQSLKKEFEGLLREREIETECFFHAMHNVNKQTISVWELGAGRADWVCATAGTIKHQLVATIATDCRCLLIEGEKEHFNWCEKHVEQNKINCVCIHGAISDHNGHVKFEQSKDQMGSSNCYGHRIGEGREIKSIVEQEIKSYTIDFLLGKYNFPEIDLLHMDCQEAEYDALIGAKKALSAGRINYMIIATHAEDMNGRIREFIRPYPYTIWVDMVGMKMQKKDAVFCPWGQAICEGDGLMFLAKRQHEARLGG